jgi:hypothetical protein
MALAARDLLRRDRHEGPRLIAETGTGQKL